MQEDFLHYLWKHKKFSTKALQTTLGDVIQIFSVGTLNNNTGPDFFNAKIKIANQLWAGNVEIHVNSSDWYLHNHELDENYDNVILHVVWQHDAEIHRKDNSVIPTLELKPIVSKTSLQNYKKLFSKKQAWINCESDFSSVSSFVVNNWLERLYLERLERKHTAIKTLLLLSKNNWEAVFFKMIAKNFGLKVNGEAFLSLANSFQFKLVQKIQNKQLALEALFFGQANLLQEEIQDTYYLQLQKEYAFLVNKYSLTNAMVIPMQFFRLRPSNFPTLRLSQLASLYHQHQNLFSKILEAKSIEAIYKLFQVKIASYWKNHYTFGKVSKVSNKRITNSFIDLLIINTIVPIRFSYAKNQGKPIDETIVSWMQQIALEKNSVVAKFQQLKPEFKTALQSQALIQLKSVYCNKNKCLQCAIGNNLLTT